MDPGKIDKGSVLIMIETFSKFSMVVLASYQIAEILTKALVNRWFCYYCIPARIHRYKGNSFDNSIIVQLPKLYGIDKQN